MAGNRIEHDALGPVGVPADRLWGAQTQRSLQNFPIGEDRVPLALVRAVAEIKRGAARAHRHLGTLDAGIAEAIDQAATEVIDGKHDGEFPLRVWQTGSGTHSHMNVNEVLANRASELLGGGRGADRKVHPNDHVNLGQSSNDVMPSAVHIAALASLDEVLIPGVAHLRDAIALRAAEFADITKTGRTHYMDATPVTMGQELGAWVSLLDRAIDRLSQTRSSLLQLALGGTAVGTGLNAPLNFADRAVLEIALATSREFVRAPDPFAALSADDAPVAYHGQLKALAVVLLKIANDVRFLASGPRTGIGELQLPANEPGSSIMPGKVNPTQAEAVVQVCAQVIGNDAAMAVTGTQSHLQLSVTRPHVAFLLLWSGQLLADACRTFADRAIAGLEPNRARIAELLDRSLMLVTALTPHIGYDNAARIAKHAHAAGISLKEAAVALGLVSTDDYDRLVRPEAMTGRQGE